MSDAFFHHVQTYDRENDSAYNAGNQRVDSLSHDIRLTWRSSREYARKDKEVVDCLPNCRAKLYDGIAKNQQTEPKDCGLLSCEHCDRLSNIRYLSVSL